MKIDKRVLMVLFAGLALGLSGCQSMKSGTAKNGQFDYDGMPARKYIVGGGYHISYRAMVEGDLFLAEDHSNRLLATITLQPGEKHEVQYDVNNTDMISNLKSLGIDPAQAVFRLYFVPR